MPTWGSGQPAYQQVVDDLCHRIDQQEFTVGDALPSYTEIAQTYRVSSNVARSAVRKLRELGIAVTHQGKGTFVASSDMTVKSTLPGDIAALQRGLQVLDQRVQVLESKFESSARTHDNNSAAEKAN